LANRKKTVNCLVSYPFNCTTSWLCKIVSQKFRHPKYSKSLTFSVCHVLDLLFLLLVIYKFVALFIRH
jgi:hypothetical protein